MQDSNGDFGEFQKLPRTHARNSGLFVLQGATASAAAGLLQGADGYAPSIAPLFPELFVRMYEAGTRSDATATFELNGLVAETSGIPGMSKNAIAANKYALSLFGFTDKRVVRPQDMTSPEEEKMIASKVEAINEKLRVIGVL